MAASTSYSQLLADIQRETEDDSTEFETEFPRLLADVQDRLQRDLDLRMFHVYTATSLTFNSQTKALDSASWLRVDHITYDDTGVPIEERSYPFIKMHGTGSGRPRYYCRDTETTILVWPKPDQNYAVTFDVLSRMAALSTSNETNWLTLNVADLYLVAALAESERFLKSIARANDYEKQYAQILRSVKREMGHAEATPQHASTAGTMMEAREG